MSIRSAPNPAIQKALADSANQITSVDNMDVTDASVLGEGTTGFVSNDPNNPLVRNVVVNVKASLSDLSTSNGKGAWKPNIDTLKAIFQQKMYTDLGGNNEPTGDLKSVIIHSIESRAIKSSFPIAVGARVTGVDEKVYSSTGNAYSMIALPSQNTAETKTLQEEDTTVAYDFAKRYPGFNADNLESNGIHQVPQRRFVLVASTHPLVTAIQENSQALQTSDITEMDQLVKISSSMYTTLMPLVKQQVKSQIKVLDMSNMGVSLSPADYENWTSAADAITKEEIMPIKAAQKRALKAAAGNPEAIEKINMEYADQIEEAQTKIANKPLDFFMELQMKYNFL